MPKMSSDSSIEPPFPPSSLMTSSFIRLRPQLPALRRPGASVRWLRRRASVRPRLRRLGLLGGGFHDRRSLLRRRCRRLGLLRRPCGRRRASGRPCGAAIFTASRIFTNVPSVPGTAPFTRIRPRSTSTRQTVRLRVVTVSWPRWPAIFLPLKVLPGSWRWPVEPCARCETETPWVARMPPKFQRFMAPGSPCRR